MTKNLETIYIAAALFNGREIYFNSRLVKGLEEKGYKTYIPQRDGFEFGDLTCVLTKKLPPRDVNPVLEKIIYLLDMGLFIPKSNVVLANLDEPLDEGVVTEITFARLIGKFIIGLRTDVRSPYGLPSNPLKGMHFFPAYQCNKLISYNMLSKNFEEAEEKFDTLINKIDIVIKKRKSKSQQKTTSSPHIKSVINAANTLFKGIKDIHSEEGLENIVKRYIQFKSKLIKINPEVV